MTDKDSAGEARTDALLQLQHAISWYVDAFDTARHLSKEIQQIADDETISPKLRLLKIHASASALSVWLESSNRQVEAAGELIEFLTVVEATEDAQRHRVAIEDEHDDQERRLTGH